MHRSPCLLIFLIRYVADAATDGRTISSFHARLRARPISQKESAGTWPGARDRYSRDAEFTTSIRRCSSRTADRHGAGKPADTSYNNSAGDTAGDGDNNSGGASTGRASADAASRDDTRSDDSSDGACNRSGDTRYATSSDNALVELLRIAPPSTPKYWSSVPRRAPAEH